MISIEQVREYMARQYAEDSGIRSVQVEGESIEDALEQASVELGLPVKSLEYEVTERGERGFLGVGKKMWVLRVYEAAKKAAMPEVEGGAAGEEEYLMQEEELPKDRNGEVAVRLIQEGVFLKVIPPVGKGKRVSERQALDAIRDRHVTDFDGNQISKVIKRAD